jgi:hypothetical protein
MDLPLPHHFYPELSEYKLKVIADILLAELHSTYDDLQSEYDSNYTRGTTTFGRQHSRLLKTSMSGEYPWLSISNSSNALVGKIESIPFRYSNDDPSAPKKPAVVSINPYQMDFALSTDSDCPKKFCFIVDKGVNGDADPRVVFVGSDSNSNTPMCAWYSDKAVFGLYDTQGFSPASVKIERPPINPKRSNDGKDDVINDLPEK